MNAEGRHTCPSCGNELSEAIESCPVCMLREALAGGVESGESSVELTPEQTVQSFEHYQLLKGEDGKPVELGRGAMGVTYKAFDIDLHRLATLKVISERYLGDESARLRFLREARAAASVRHPNVASVFHLGKTGGNYFYAMEFVEGETLANLIRRSGRVEVKLALEIVTGVAAGLEAVHKQQLIHRDIKPSNIMVCVEEGNTLTTKIIDLGLAKAVNESGSRAAISVPGGFAGTPEFASPEQFAGVGVDIRSDLYSLGAVFWEMMTSHVLFRGSPGEVMYQHQHAPLPLEELEHVAQPAVVLLEILLEKDPGRRFQNPTELLKAIPTITDAIDAERSISRQKLRETLPAASRAETRKPQAILGPEKISVARLPVTGGDVFGREEDIAFLDHAWVNSQINVLTIVAWAGVGKSTLINSWVRRLAVEHYRSAELVFGWSFYRQGSSGKTSSADEFLDAALTWFGDSDPQLGTAWEKGERLAKLVAHRRTLLILDGLEPHQNPPGSQEGRLREPSLQALIRELAAFNTGLCVITTRLPVADIADHERTSALRRDLEQLSSESGAKLLRALGITGHESELESASDEFGGHCLALTLLGSYLTDAYNGDIRCRKEVSEPLVHDVRQGVHARKVMESYQTWFGEGPKLSVLRILGLFDRPADEKALDALLTSPAIPNLTESLTELRPTERRTILARLRRARLLSREDPRNPGQLDTHPLIREYFSEQLRSKQTEAWKECNRRLFHYYRTLAPPLPNSFREMEPLFSAVICGCDAGLFRDALHEVYIPRIQRGNGLWRYSINVDKLSKALRIAERVYSLAQEQDYPRPIIGAYNALSLTLYFLGDFESAQKYAMRGVQIWRSGCVQSHAEDFYTPVVGCLCYAAMSEWHLGEIACCQAKMDEAVSVAKELKDTFALALALSWAAVLAFYERNPAEVDRLASDLIELSTRHNFVHWLALGAIYRGWARSASGDTAEGIQWIERGIKDYRANGSMLGLPGLLARKAEALHQADRTSEALEAINEAEALAERFGQRDWSAELHRFRGLFPAALWVPIRCKLKLRSAKPSESHVSRSRFRSRDGPKQPTRNIAGKKRARWEDTGSDCLFDSICPLL